MDGRCKHCKYDHESNDDVIACLSARLAAANLQNGEMKKQQESDIYVMGEISKCREEAFKQVDDFRGCLEAIDRKLREDGHHKEGCPGSHPAHCTCLTGEIRRGIKMTLEGRAAIGES